MLIRAIRVRLTLSLTVVSVVPVVFVVLKLSSSQAHRAIRVDSPDLCSFYLQQQSYTYIYKKPSKKPLPKFLLSFSLITSYLSYKYNF